MATLMEKDVLLEVAASAMATIFHAEGKTEETKRVNDRKFVSDTQARFYSTKPENLDYQTELNTLMTIEKKYEVFSGL